jgi:hypothetical protein
MRKICYRLRYGNGAVGPSSSSSTEDPRAERDGRLELFPRVSIWEREANPFATLLLFFYKLMSNVNVLEDD